MSPASKLHAVIVDDESSYLYLLETILEEILTCPIKAYTHPEMALQELPDLEVGIIVTDFYMPKMDGVEFLQKVEQIKPAVPCIIISGHKQLLDTVDTTDIAQLKAVLAKPFKINALVEEITRLWPEAIA
tara:strand:+ start:14775 stop:15164 length:390 start_codon:yes stop_codon:yes gene_type:complete